MLSYRITPKVSEKDIGLQRISWTTGITIIANCL